MNEKIERVRTSLEIEEDINLHITGWIFQRIGWGLMLGFLVLAALGFFGDGMMSEERLVDGETALVFDRYARRESDTQMEIIARSTDGKVKVTLSPDFNQAYKIERMTPEPASQSMNNGASVLEFPTSGQAQITFFLTIREQQIGQIQSAVTVNGSHFTLNNYIYP